MNESAWKTLFGPVLSRRLGLSLGVEMVPTKVCSMNCIYCECGRTTLLTNERKEYTPVELIRSELDRYLQTHPRLDAVTLTGAGEPTLNSGFGTIVQHLKHLYGDYVHVVLTNATPLVDPEVRREMLDLDIVVPSLDAVSETLFRKITRPARSVRVQEVIEALIRFRREYSGKIWLEVFMIGGLNDTPEELERLTEAVERINPDRVHVNALDRPGAESWVKPMSQERLQDIAARIGPRAEVIARPQPTKSGGDPRSNSEQLRETIRRRPSTLDDLVQSLGLSETEVRRALAELDQKGLLEKEKLPRGEFYRLRP